jgi:phosphopantetheinyl transferase (holo-ACP synthase)
LEVWKHKSGIARGGFDLGKPYLRSWQEGKKVDYPLSISHEKDYVVAVVMNMPIPETDPVERHP